MVVLFRWANRIDRFRVESVVPSRHANSSDAIDSGLCPIRASHENPGMTVASAAPVADPPGTNDTAGARRIAGAFATAHAAGRAALIPYVVAGYPDRETSFRAALAAIDAGADLLELGLPYSDPLADGATLQRASGVALANGATLDGSLDLIERIAAARPAIPLVPMGYANQFIGGGDGRESARRLSGAGVAGVIVADLTPDEGGPFESVAREHGIAVVYLVAPTTPAPPPSRDRQAQRRVPVLRLARRGHRCEDHVAVDGWAARSRRRCGLARAGRGRVRGQQARTRAGARPCRSRWRRRRISAGRRARSGRRRHRADGQARRRPCGSDGPMTVR